MSTKGNDYDTAQREFQRLSGLKDDIRSRAGGIDGIERVLDQLQEMIDERLVVLRELDPDTWKAASVDLTKDMSQLMEVAKLLGQIGTAGAAMYVGAGAARETYDALRAKCREMMDKLDEAQNQLDDIDPRELDAEMRSAPNVNETKSFADIMNFLYAAGIVFIGGTMLWDRREAIMGRIESAIDAFTEALTNLRYGNDMEDLQRSIDILRNAGVQVPDEIQAIADDPRNGDSTIAGGNIAYARGFLTEALHHLQEAQARAESMPDEQRSDPRPADVKSAGAHSFYR